MSRESATDGGPRHMLAAIYERYGAPDVVQLRNVPIPEPRAHEVQVRIHATTVSSGDWRARSLDMPRGFGLLGRLVFGLRTPRQPILGTEFSGEISAVGAHVTRFKIGDQVFGFPGSAMGSHAEYRCMAEDGLLAIKPPELSHTDAAALSFGGLNALGFLRKARVQAGERIAINGASGAVGVAAIQLAKHLGAHVTAVSSGGNLALSESLGADDVVDYTTRDFTRGSQFDVILDTAGTSPFARARQALTPTGRFVPVHGSLADLLRAPWVNTTGPQRIIAGVVRSHPADLDLLSSLATRGVYRAVIERQFDFADIADAHRLVDSGRKRGSVVIRVRR